MEEKELKDLSIKITAKLISKIVLKLNELKSKNKNNTKIVSWDFDTDTMEVFGEFEYGVKFREKILLGGEE